MKEEETQGRSRGQQAPGTIASWPRDLGTQTFSSNQGNDSIEQKCHDLKPYGRRKQEKKKGILLAKPQKSLTSGGARRRDKQEAVEQRESSSLPGTGRAFSSSQSPSLLWVSLPSSVSRQNTQLLGHLSRGLGLPSWGPALWLHGVLLKTNPSH